MSLAAAVAAAAFLLVTPPARACAFLDQHVHFHSDHPASVEVAVAAAGEIQSGRLAPIPADDRVQLLALQLAVGEKMKEFGQRVASRLSAARVDALPEFFVLTVQTRMWGRLRPEDGRFSDACDPIAPELIHEAEERGAIIVISEPVLRDLAAGRISYADAESRGLLVMDGATAAVGRLRTELAEALR